MAWELEAYLCVPCFACLAFFSLGDDNGFHHAHGGLETKGEEGITQLPKLEKILLADFVELMEIVWIPSFTCA